MAADTGLEEKLLAVRAYLKQPIHEILPPRLLFYLIPPLPSWPTVLTCVLLVIALLARLYFILPRNAINGSNETVSKKDNVKVAVFLGSGMFKTSISQSVRDSDFFFLSQVVIQRSYCN